MIKININIQTDVELDFNIKNIIKKVTKKVLHSDKIYHRHVINFILVDNRLIQEVNKQYRHIDEATDVISFAEIDNCPNRKLSYELGDIFISMEKVLEQADEYGHTPLREFAFLITHGVLHLLGYDHIDKLGEVEMFEKQAYILEKLKIRR